MERRNEWLDLLDAARRKGEIARNALSELKRVVPARYSMEPQEAPEKPAVSVQRNFEGVIGAAVAAIDQICTSGRSSNG